jgi:hypothetical protein
MAAPYDIGRSPRDAGDGKYPTVATSRVLRIKSTPNMRHQKMHPPTTE